MKENYDKQIDRTLLLIGSASPDAGMEDRILARIAQVGTSRKAPRFFSLPQLAFGMSAAAAASLLIVVGSVNHSRHMLPIAPGIHIPAAAQPGVGAASAAHVAPQPVTSLPHDRPRSVRNTVNGRAVISPKAKRPAGVAVPKTLPSQQ
jgi:hypothetical protein